MVIKPSITNLINSMPLQVFYLRTEKSAIYSTQGWDKEEKNSRTFKKGPDDYLEGDKKKNGS